ncbi:MAG: protein jag [Anaerorhabdus sp.]
MSIYSAKTIEDILDLASKEKGVEISELYHYIVNEKKGLLGLGTTLSAEVYANEDIKEFIFDYLGDFFTNLNQSIEIEILIKDNEFNINLNAENNAILIGKNGLTLRSLNFVLSSAVNAHFRNRFNIIIDINNYRHDRYSRVKFIAKRAAISVQKTKIDASLDPMPNDERKVIHKYLEGFKNVSTKSEGEGNNRHLKIFYVSDSKE